MKSFYQLYSEKKNELVTFLSLFLLYFIQAMPFGFQSRYLPLVMRKNGVSITSLGLFKLLLIPWACKFFIAAFFVDVYKTKRFWLTASLIALSIGSYLGAFFNEIDELAVLLLFLNTASASQDVCVDWFSMNVLKKEDLGIGNTIQVGGFKLGTLFSGGLLVFLIDYISISQTFFILGSVYLASVLLLKLSLFNMENENQKYDNSNDEETKQISLKERFNLVHRSPATYWMIVFTLIYKLGEQSSLNLLPIYLLDRKIPSSEIGFYTGIVGQTFSIFGSLLGGIMLKKSNRKISSMTWLKLGVYVRLFPIILISLLVIKNESVYSNAVETFEFDNLTLNLIIILVQIQLFFSGILTTFTFTVMMEVSFLAPKNIQATHFSLLATCEVLGKLLCQPLISAFTDYYGYSNAFILFSLLYIICLIHMKFKPIISQRV